MYKVHSNKKTGAHRATAAMFGTMVGAGVFALPSAIAMSGVVIGVFWMVLLGGAALLLHLIFGEIVLKTPGQHRLVGYCRIYLGRWAADVQAFASVLGMIGGSLAYLILGGLFLHQLVLPWTEISPDIFSFGLFIVTAVTVWKGANFLARIDFWLSAALATVLLIIIAKSLFHIETTNLVTVDYGQAFLPYGIVLFSFGGLSAVTEMRDVLGRHDPTALRKSITYGTLGAVFLTIFFAVTTVGVLGPATSSESISGLAEVFGGAMPVLGAAAGFLAVITSYIVFSLFLKEQFHYDFKWPHGISWAVSVITPFLLFLMGIRSFGKVLAVVGSVLGGIGGIFVCMAYLKVRKKYQDDLLKPPLILIYLLMGIFAGGAIYQLIFAL